MKEKKSAGRPEKAKKLRRVGLLVMVTDQNKKELKKQLQVIANKLDLELNAEKKAKLLKQKS